MSEDIEWGEKYIVDSTLSLVDVNREQTEMQLHIQIKINSVLPSLNIRHV